MQLRLATTRIARQQQTLKILTSSHHKTKQNLKKRAETKIYSTQ